MKLFTTLLSTNYTDGNNACLIGNYLTMDEAEATVKEKIPYFVERLYAYHCKHNEISLEEFIALHQHGDNTWFFEDEDDGMIYEFTIVENEI